MPIHDHVKSDRELQRDVLDELAWDARVAAHDIGVEVRGGVVTLTGTVPSWAMKTAAQQAAHRVSGVLDVANDVHVRLLAEGPSDPEIAAAVRDALKWDVFVPDERIQSTVSSGAVTLEGNVETYVQREDAERAVRNLSGVRGVVNSITVTIPAPTPDALRASIHHALERHADRETDKLQIDVENGRVTVHGAVQSWNEHDAVIGAVTSTRGVTSIVDRLRIA